MLTDTEFREAYCNKRFSFRLRSESKPSEEWTTISGVFVRMSKSNELGSWFDSQVWHAVFRKVRVIDKELVKELGKDIVPFLELGRRRKRGFSETEIYVPINKIEPLLEVEKNEISMLWGRFLADVLRTYFPRKVKRAKAVGSQLGRTSDQLLS